MSKTSRMEKVRHELLADVAEQVASVLVEFNIMADEAEQCGSAIADHLASHWGGQHITIPMDYAWKLSARDLQIWEKFNGTNHAELAREFKVTTNAIYRIIKRTKRGALAHLQVDIFDEC